MGSFRFYRRVHIFPGLSVNFSKSGPSLTVGMRGAHVTLGHRGITRTVGLPGTGIYYTSRSGYHSGIHLPPSDTAAAQPAEVTEHHLMGCVTLAIIVAVALVVGVMIGTGLSLH